MQKHVNLVDLVKSFPTNIYLQNLASIQKRTRPKKFAHLAEKSGKGSISNLSTKAPTLLAHRQGRGRVRLVAVVTVEDDPLRQPRNARAHDLPHEHGRVLPLAELELEHLCFFLTFMLTVG